MDLQKLKLTNFKGIRNLILEPKGQNISVWGDNGTGKTTLFDAWTWLLFGKDSLNRADFEIKTLDESGQPIHGLNHEVEAVLGLSAKTICLRKVYAEKWTKKRGSPQAEFTGHTTDHFIDDVPVKEKDYRAAIDAIIQEEAFKLLSNPRHFNEVLHWQERRRILLEVCGDVSDEDVIASDSALALLPTILAGRKMDDHRKVINAKRQEINKELEKIPVRIDEVNKGLPAPVTTTAATFHEIVQDLKSQRQAKLEEKARTEAGGGVADKTKQLREVEGRMLSYETEHKSRTASQVQETKKALVELQDRLTGINQDIRGKQRQIADNSTAIAHAEQKLTSLRSGWQLTNSETFTFEQTTTCPTCGQALPEDQLQAARDKALTDFNGRKAQNLQEMEERGKAIRADINTTNQENEALAKEIDALADKMQPVDGLIHETEAKIEALNKQALSFASQPDYLKMAEEKRKLQEAIIYLRSSNADALNTIAQEVRNLDNQIAEHEKAIARIGQREEGLKRIEELKAQERQLAKTYEQLEKELYLTEQFVRSKVKLLEERINSRFSMARFKLFNQLVNGGTEEVCETTYLGVPYSSLNNSARINIGLDIVNTLSEHYGFEVPIWADNAEAVTQLLDTKGQQIRLYVSEPDKQLRIQPVKELAGVK